MFDFESNRFIQNRFNNHPTNVAKNLMYNQIGIDILLEI